MILMENPMFCQVLSLSLPSSSSSSSSDQSSTVLKEVCLCVSLSVLLKKVFKYLEMCSTFNYILHMCTCSKVKQLLLCWLSVKHYLGHNLSFCIQLFLLLFGWLTIMKSNCNTPSVNECTCCMCASRTAGECRSSATSLKRMWTGSKWKTSSGAGWWVRHNDTGSISTKNQGWLPDHTGCNTTVCVCVCVLCRTAWWIATRKFLFLRGLHVQPKGEQQFVTLETRG